MKQYTADKHAQYTLQIATPIVTAVLIGLIWYFLAVLPHWLLWTLTAVLAAAAILLSTLLLPMWFCTVTYCVSATHITRKCGIFFIQEQVMRTQALQFSSIFQALCRCHRHEFYPAACLWRHGHSVVFEQF